MFYQFLESQCEIKAFMFESYNFAISKIDILLTVKEGENKYPAEEALSKLCQIIQFNCEPRLLWPAWEVAPIPEGFICKQI